MVPRGQVIDSEGNVWEGLPRQLAPYVGQQGLAKLLDYAILNMGYIGVRPAPTGWVVSLRPSSVTPQGYLALVPLLTESPDARTIVQSFDKGWTFEILSNAYRAAQRISELLEPHFARAGGTMQVLEVDQRKKPLRNALAGVLDVWRHRVDAVGFAELMAQADILTRGRFMIYEYDRDAGDFICHHAGTGYNAWAKPCPAYQPGGRISHHTDGSLALESLASYRATCRRMTPVLQNVDALVNWGEKARRRNRYQRLLLPFRYAKRDQLLLTASIEDPSIDLFRRRG